MAGLIAALYLGVLAAPGARSGALLAGLAALCTGLLAWAWRTGERGSVLVMVAWVPLHLALLATGSITSPLLPLIAAWAAWLAWKTPRQALGGVLGAGATLTWAAWADTNTIPVLALVEPALLLALGFVAARLRARRFRLAASTSTRNTQQAPMLSAATDDVVLTRTLELVRRATDADEATLWVAEPRGDHLLRRAWAGTPEQTPPPERVPLDGHPFAWAVLERVHVHLQRGRKPLPNDWAAEMLLVPVDAPGGVLALSFRNLVPPGTEATALSSSGHLGELLSLLGVQTRAQLDQHRIAALLGAIRSLPGELQTDRFAYHLADAVRQITGASGSAVALWDSERVQGTVLRAGQGSAPALLRGTTFGEGESRLALAVKYGVTLAFDDLAREADSLPLCARGERWEEPPRSALLVPLLADGHSVGAVIAWHREPFRFGSEEQEFVHLLASVAPLPLQSARRFEELDRRASTDALTGLPNRGAFEARLAALAGHFDRYGRPFGLLVLDIDFFKRFNDTWGHEIGDRVLQHVGELIRSRVREGDLPARLGGEEFVILLPETSLRESAETAERVRKAIEAHPLAWNGRTLRITASAGVASCPECVSGPGELLNVADAALYQSKEDGRNRVTVAPTVVRQERGSSR